MATGTSGRTEAGTIARAFGTHALAGLLVFVHIASVQGAVSPEDRDAARGRMLGRVLTDAESPHFCGPTPLCTKPLCCFVNNPSPAQLERIKQKYGFMSPAEDRFADRFNPMEETVWEGDAQQGLRGRSLRARLTYSFPADGTPWGEPDSFQSPNVLASMIEGVFGSSNRDFGLELIRHSLSSWQKYTGLTFEEVTDDNTPMTRDPQRVVTRGDLRIGAISNPQEFEDGTLAYNYGPTSGGDMTFISEWYTSDFQGGDNNYRYIRNVSAHEFGHGFGLDHVSPCDESKLMEPFIGLVYDQAQIDDRRALQWNYGDRFSGNQNAAAAVDLGNLTLPSVRSVIERYLSTNRHVNASGMNSDWFKFTLSSPQPVTISAAPTGGTYLQGDQDGDGCAAAVLPIGAISVGNLNLELRSENGMTLVQQTGVAPAGQTEFMTIPALSAGTYWFRVFDSSAPTSSLNDSLQTYDLTVRVGASKAAPLAIAGMHKRMRAGHNCYFLGDIDSEANEGTLVSYEWDFDGDGVFDSTDPQAVTRYDSNGVFNVTLRVTDSHGSTDTDTIRVTVVGATTTLTGVSPGSGLIGSSTPITIAGTNLLGVSAASQFSVNGTGVTISGTPVINAKGTLVTGLTINIAPGTTVGARSLTVSAPGNPAATLNGAFIVVSNQPSNDECAAAELWLEGDGTKPVSTLNATTSTNQNFAGTACAGSSINNDVWYTWSTKNDSLVTVTPPTQQQAGIAARVAVYNAGCVGSPIACGNAAQSFQFNAIGGNGYLFRVGAATPGQTGTTSVSLALAPATGACCNVNGGCQTSSPADCTSGGGVYKGSFVVCTPGLCPLPNGACCLTDGSCIELIRFNCDNNGGLWKGLGTTCQTVICQANVGACCSGVTCVLTTQGQCSGQAKKFKGSGVACNTPGNLFAPCCRADFTQTSGVNVQDIFDFLAAWFSLNPQSDYDLSGTTDTQDIFDFLAAWFAGC